MKFFFIPDKTVITISILQEPYVPLSEESLVTILFSALTRMFPKPTFAP